MATYDPAVEIAGVILNQAGSPRHAAEVADVDRPAGARRARPRRRGSPSRRGTSAWSRPPSATRRAHALDRLADRVAEHVDLDAVLAIARSAPDLDAAPWDPAREVSTGSTGSRAGARSWRDGRRPGVHLPLRRDRGAARARPGCDVVDLRPARRPARCPTGTAGHLPRRWLPRGARRATLTRQRVAPRATCAAAVAAGVPTVAECAGLLYLCRVARRRPDGRCARRPTAAMTERLTLRYPTMTATSRHPAHPGRRAGDRARVPPHARRPGRRRDRRPGRVDGEAGRLRGADPARVVPPHPLGRPPAARPAVRRRGARRMR